MCNSFKLIEHLSLLDLTNHLFKGVEHLNASEKQGLREFHRQLSARDTEVSALELCVRAFGAWGGLWISIINVV